MSKKNSNGHPSCAICGEPVWFDYPRGPVHKGGSRCQLSCPSCGYQTTSLVDSLIGSCPKCRTELAVHHYATLRKEAKC